MPKNITNRLTVSTYLLKSTVSLEDWISQAEAARIRGVSRQAIARLVKQGRFNVLRVGGKTLLNRPEVKAFKPNRPGRRRGK
jgi:excisionase family DNA binding protein